MYVPKLQKLENKTGDGQDSASETHPLSKHTLTDASYETGQPQTSGKGCLPMDMRTTQSNLSRHDPRVLLTIIDIDSIYNQTKTIKRSAAAFSPLLIVFLLLLLSFFMLLLIRLCVCVSVFVFCFLCCCCYCFCLPFFVSDYYPHKVKSNNNRERFSKCDKR